MHGVEPRKIALQHLWREATTEMPQNPESLDPKQSRGSAHYSVKPCFNWSRIMFYKPFLRGKKDSATCKPRL